jgi:hypothetical protein
MGGGVGRDFLVIFIVPRGFSKIPQIVPQDVPNNTHVLNKPLKPKSHISPYSFSELSNFHNVGSMR